MDPNEAGAFESARTERIKAIFLESTGNLNATQIDLERTAEIAHARGIPLVVDSTFAPPFLRRPFEHGADIVVHSATKFIGGHDTAIVDSGRFDGAKSRRFPGLTEQGIHPNAIRLSIGTEHIDDILADFSQAFEG